LKVVEKIKKKKKMSVVPAWKARQQEQEREREAKRKAEDEARQRKLAELNPNENSTSRRSQICQKCKFKDPQQSKFCTSCGALLETESENHTSSSTTSPTTSSSSPSSTTKVRPVPPTPATNGRPLPVATRSRTSTPSASTGATNTTTSPSVAPLPRQRSLPPITTSTTTLDSEASRRAKKQIVQLRKLGDAKLTKKRMFPSGFLELEAVVPRGLVQAGDTISVGVVVQNKSVRDVVGVRVRLEQQTLIATASGGYELHDTITWRTFEESAPVPAQSSSEVVVSCAIPRHTPPSGSRQATDSNVDGRAAWFVYKLIVSTEAHWVANPRVLFDVELRGHPSVQPVGPGAHVPGSGATTQDATSAAPAEAASGRTRLTHSRRDMNKGSTIDMHCVGCGDRSLARICARCFGAGRAAAFCAECGQVFTDDRGNAVECGKCGTPRGVLPPGAPLRPVSPPPNAPPEPLPRRAGTEKYSNRAKSPPLTPGMSPSVADVPLSPRGTFISKPTGVQRNPDAVKAMLAAAGVNSSIVDSGLSSVSAPTDVQRNPEAVRAMLAAAGVDPAVVDHGRAPALSHSFSKPSGFQRNPEAVKALLVAAGVDTAVVQTVPSSPAAAPAPLVRPLSAKQLPQIPVSKPATNTAATGGGGAASVRPKLCMICQQRPTAARVARHGKELYLCRECTLEQREKFKARGTINIGASPVRKGPRPPADPKPSMRSPPAPSSPRRTNQYVDLELLPAPTAEQLERLAEEEMQQLHHQQSTGGGDGEVEVSAVDVVGKCVALFEFVAEHESELALNEGDQVNITCFVDDEWLEGFIDDKNGVRGGLFPKAYVREIAF
jgi:hypothetical protein